MNNQEIKQKIAESITQAKGRGYTVVSESWGNQEQLCACPLGCTLVAANMYIDDDEGSPNDKDLAALIGVNSEWITSFIDGFDDNGMAESSFVDEAWKMGSDFRKEIKPISYSEFTSEMEEED